VNFLEYTKIRKAFCRPHSMDARRRWRNEVDDDITHVGMIVGDGVIILPPRVFDKPLRWYLRLKEIKKYNFH
jgi:hypothetical protein